MAPPAPLIQAHRMALISNNADYFMRFVELIKCQILPVCQQQYRSNNLQPSERDGLLISRAQRIVVALAIGQQYHFRYPSDSAII